ncbi:MAG: biotin--[acetyl-CoA-carboxylase] ligase [Aestuariivita sp.]|nr:biotin--[acetyl-CoA-carboxylase] ligase [Aestuariivita sp.]
MNWPPGYGCRLLDEVSSTLDEARRLAPRISQPEWILARRQTSARGRYGRSWFAPEGNFSATLVMHPRGAMRIAALQSFVAAVALFDTVAEVIGSSDDLSLKWPNDILLNDGKLAGILLESMGDSHKVTYLAIGIGVNLVDRPSSGQLVEAVTPPVSLLNETGILIEPIRFLNYLAIAFDQRERDMHEYGFSFIRDIWLSRAARLGEEIRVRTATTDKVGIFETVDSGGNLVLKTFDKRIVIPAADVFFEGEQ